MSELTDIAGLAPIPDEFAGQNDLIEQVIASDVQLVTAEQAAQAEQSVAEAQEKPVEPWFVITTQDGPVLVMRLLPTGWDIVVKDEHSPLTDRQKNLLIRAMAIKLKRHRRALVRQHGNVVRKTQAQKDEEIRAALRDSYEKGQLLGV